MTGFRGQFFLQGIVFKTKISTKHFWAIVTSMCSVTRFGKILPKLKSLGQYLKDYLVFRKILNLFWQTLYAIGYIFIVANEKILNNYFSILSH